MEYELKKRRCCFTGHRPEKLCISEAEAKALLRKAIENAISDGIKTFISGMARGIDMWATEIILEIKKEKPYICLICALPYDGFEKRWGDTEQKKYRYILSCADLVKVICDGYNRYCFQIRNEWMVNHSVMVISAYNGVNGGTKNTIYYAKRKGVKIENIIRI